MEEHVTFSGVEASKITAESLMSAVDLLNKYKPKELEVELSHNCEKEDFIKALGIQEKKDEPFMSSLFGMRVYRKSYIPLGEIWLVDKNGQVLEKYKI